jgi:hypothetical protein
MAPDRNALRRQANSCCGRSPFATAETFTPARQRLLENPPLRRRRPAPALQWRTLVQPIDDIFDDCKAFKSALGCRLQTNLPRRIYTGASPTSSPSETWGQMDAYSRSWLRSPSLSLRGLGRGGKRNTRCRGGPGSRLRQGHHLETPTHKRSVTLNPAGPLCKTMHKGRPCKRAILKLSRELAAKHRTLPNPSRADFRREQFCSDREGGAR